MTPTALTTKVRYFDLDKFEAVSKEVSYTHSDATSLAEAMARVSGDEGKLLKAINTGLKREAMISARKEQVPENAVPPSVISKFVGPIAMFPQFSSLPENTPEERKAKKQAIYLAIKSNPFLLDGIKAAAAQAAASGEEDEPDEE